MLTHSFMGGVIHFVGGDEAIYVLKTYLSTLELASEISGGVGLTRLRGRGTVDCCFPIWTDTHGGLVWGHQGLYSSTAGTGCLVYDTRNDLS